MRKGEVKRIGPEVALWQGLGTGDGETLAALIGQVELMVGIDSGPGHVAGATETPTLIAWVRHHPVQYYGLSPNVTHLVPRDHARWIRGSREAGLKYFEKRYAHRVCGGSWREELPRWVGERLEGGRVGGDIIRAGR